MHTRVMTHSRVTHVWLIHMCDMTHAYAWHDSCIMLHLCVWLVRMRDTTRAYVRHGSFTCVTHAYEKYASFTCVTRPFCMCDMTQAYEWHTPLMSLHIWYIINMVYLQLKPNQIGAWAMSHMQTSKFYTHVNDFCHTYEWATDTRTRLKVAR